MALLGEVGSDSRPDDQTRVTFDANASMMALGAIDHFKVSPLTGRHDSSTGRDDLAGCSRDGVT
ncbi:hypothetical protein Pan189_17480 [Stratiformator vulcanicus]|uniref:Uncharacterized protein n=1 Tax=Stratiformator vulcanicus TaxID=2527980 RepID=A0A517R0L2_9PLAN|nr:hypothetical protein Pan189_17480 [Stratiformator vulcanicus]